MFDFYCENCGAGMEEPNEEGDFLCEDCEVYCERCGEYCSYDEVDGLCEDCYEESLNDEWGDD